MRHIVSAFLFYLFLMSCSPQPLTSLSNQSISQINTGQSTPAVTEPPQPTDALTKLKLKSTEYKQRYGLKDPFSKLVDNLGNKYDNLYGVRNFRVVLHGVYYRGGANNVYNKIDGVRANENPLQTGGLKNLCEEGFTNAIYLYPTNFSTAEKSASCKNFKNEIQTLKYENIIGLDKTTTPKFIQKVYDVIKGTAEGPIYGHCWNGWHSSGYVASTLLKQFCGYTDQQALDYWIQNTDKNDQGYDSAKKMVTDFKPITKYQISKEESDFICP
jgi:hypothetical protein